MVTQRNNIVYTFWILTTPFFYTHIAPPAFVKDTTPAVELLSFVKQSRLTFFSDLVEQVMNSIDNNILENDILPVIYPILKWKRVANKDLYESAHTAVISAFLAEKPVSRELAGVYSKILIEVKSKKKKKKIKVSSMFMSYYMIEFP